ncbi:helix-turn-helix transcriptional regulator [Streptomyces sp. NPDC090106]|uniref:helix-turn-helix transcriptional regulator n=1 Tax=Streptomyces sp. NPDC090106 TaxID=3365946 RepID=UPI003802565F
MAESTGTGELIGIRPYAVPGAADPATRDLSSEAISVIEARLLDPDLTPSLIARTLGVSLRTLHRSFSASGYSVMSFVRRRRLQKAHDDLLNSGDVGLVSEIAARWFFSDASHFIRKFKSLYGVTPAVYLRNSEALSPEKLRLEAAR